ncbi:MAG: tyrosine-type recombinase/integrase [bacterium]
MFKKLFKKPAVLALHRNAPYAKEREIYLTHCAQQGYARLPLRRIARELLYVARTLRILPERGVTSAQIKKAAVQWECQQRPLGRPQDPKWPRIRFVQAANQWFRFLGWFRKVDRKATAFDGLFKDYARWMESERGFAPATIDWRCRHLRNFLRWYEAKKRSISFVKIEDIDAFLTACGKKGWSRRTVVGSASALRTFFRFAGMRGWCSPSIAEAIQGPRLFSQENLPSGPAWEDVKRLIASMDTNRPSDIRDRAMIMLFAIYGLRAGEVSKLLLDDIDWKNDRMLVPRAKQRRSQPYSLMPVVGSAIIRYLQEVRPRSSHREVFLTLHAPLRPISRGALYSMTRNRMLALGIHAKQLGPHSLRHACATYLMAGGFSLKEIGDHLGHRSSSATRIYAKVDLPGLRAVATFDLGGVI